MEKVKQQLHNILNFDKSIINDYCDNFDNYWDFIPNLNNIIITIGKTLNKEKYNKIEPNIWISKDAIIDKSATIVGPCIIGSYSEVRVNSFIRGNVIIGESCIIGNSCEVKNSILFDETKIPHFNYIGDSILGYKSHFGAGSITSNIKSDESLIVVKLNKIKYNTNKRKIGAIVGDYVEIGCNCVLNPGVVIGKNTSIYPLTMVRGEIEENKIVKSMNEIVDKEGGKVLCKRI